MNARPDRSRSGRRGAAADYPQDAATYAYDEVLEPGMTLCIESYVGEEGGPEGVKPEQQVLVTESGCTVLSRFPFEQSLMVPRTSLESPLPRLPHG